jgi:hypothetical protein
VEPSPGCDVDLFEFLEQHLVEPHEFVMAAIGGVMIEPAQRLTTERRLHSARKSVDAPSRCQPLEAPCIAA